MPETVGEDEDTLLRKAVGGSFTHSLEITITIDVDQESEDGLISHYVVNTMLASRGDKPDVCTITTAIFIRCHSLNAAVREFGETQRFYASLNVPSAITFDITADYHD